MPPGGRLELDRVTVANRCRRLNAAHALPFSAAPRPQDEKEQECGSLWIIRTGAAELLAAGCSIPPLLADRAGNPLGSSGLVFLSGRNACPREALTGEVQQA
jgi:hypothetical protein